MQEVAGGFLVEHGDVDGLLAALDRCRRFSEVEKRDIAREQRQFLLKNYELNTLLQYFEHSALTPRAEIAEARTFSSEAP